MTAEWVADSGVPIRLARLGPEREDRGGGQASD